MDWKEIGKMVGSAAPVLGGLLAGPVGAIAGAACNFYLGSSLGSTQKTQMMHGGKE